MLWVTVVLIPKGNSGNYHGVGLLEPLWKLIEKILDGRIAGLETHDALHGFIKGRGEGTSTSEENMDQQLVGLCHVPLLQVLLYVRKSYDSLYRESCM